MSSDSQDSAPQDSFWESWPRLYLDTAEILEIAGGRRDHQLVADLLTTLVRTKTVLVVSRDHIQDIQGASGATRDGFMATLHVFPLVAAVEKDPYDVEPWTDGPADISLRFVPDARALFQHPAAEPHLRLFADVQTALHAATVHMQDARRAARQLSGIAEAHKTRCLVRLFMEPDDTDVAELMAAIESETGQVLENAERRAIDNLLQPCVDLLRRLEIKGKLTNEQRMKLARDVALTADGAIQPDAPGTTLARCLARGLAKNPTRNPLRSDSIDNFHASYFPYVDVATCDKGAFACIAQQLANIRRLRPTRLFRNGQLRNVIEAIAEIGKAETPPP